MNTSQDAQAVNPELESFREQWRAEVRARNPTATETQQQGTTSRQTENSKSTTPRTTRPVHLSSGKPKAPDTEEDYVQARSFDDTEPKETARQEDEERTEPVTALEHYERAVEKEAQGSLGDSLMLYRKAFRVRTIITPIVTEVMLTLIK